MLGTPIGVQADEADARQNLKAMSDYVGALATSWGVAAMAMVTPASTQLTVVHLRTVVKTFGLCFMIVS